MKREWKFTGLKCPKCGSPMIENKRYIECSHMQCDYIEKYKLTHQHQQQLPKGE